MSLAEFELHKFKDAFLPFDLHPCSDPSWYYSWCGGGQEKYVETVQEAFAVAPDIGLNQLSSGVAAAVVQKLSIAVRGSSAGALVSFLFSMNVRVICYLKMCAWLMRALVR
mmetsp:Transcript_2011/g.2993  ORF Transcript_2011/g.2993 Transcript_2011/m.2993 type:complete len:111 (-) Transcript_2011:221-553(-)